MINELRQLSQAMEESNINGEIWHQKYKPIPNIRANAPCVRILIDDGKVIELSSVDQNKGSCLRKFGTNQGSYPCMNLAPLYRITDSEVKKKLSSLRPEDLDEDRIDRIRNWCTDSNWGSKFQGKYKVSMKNTTTELASLVPDFKSIQILIGQSNYFLDSAKLHQEMENVAFEMLSSKHEVSLALSVLFHYGNPDKNAVDDYGSISVAFDSPKLIMGMSVVSNKFTASFNACLLSAESTRLKKNDVPGIDASYIVDAFGIKFDPLEQPMPEVKLAGGFDVKLRTMFKEQHCQTRYRKIENASYPISPLMREKLQASLNWSGRKDKENIIWINTDRNEILFAYPVDLIHEDVSYTRMFKRAQKNENAVEKEIAFEEQAKRFITEIRSAKKPGADSNAEKIELFILRKIDKARTKVVYTRQTDPYELENKVKHGQRDAGISRLLLSAYQASHFPWIWPIF